MKDVEQTNLNDAGEQSNRKVIWHPLPFFQLTSGSTQQCGNAVRNGQTDRQTDTQTAVTNMHFASVTLHAKCNNN